MESKFRFNAKTLFATYSGITDPQFIAGDILEHLQGLGPLKCAVIGKEIAPTTGLVHFHVLASYQKKLDIKQREALLVKGFGVNVRKVKSKLGAYEYVTKDQDLTEFGKFDFYKFSNNFRKEYGDHQSWKNYRYQMQLTSCYPFKLPNGSICDKPQPQIKLRHYWIVGATSSGKTYWLNNTFKGKSVYLRSRSDKYPYDSYMCEECIAFDDITPKLEELLYMSNVYTLRARVFGDTRYYERHMEPDSLRTLIVLSNKQPRDVYVKDENEDLLRWEAFESRFIIINI